MAEASDFSENDHRVFGLLSGTTHGDMLGDWELLKAVDDRLGSGATDDLVSQIEGLGVGRMGFTVTELARLVTSKAVIADMLLQGQSVAAEDVEAAKRLVGATEIWATAQGMDEVGQALAQQETYTAKQLWATGSSVRTSVALGAADKFVAEAIEAATGAEWEGTYAATRQIGSGMVATVVATTLASLGAKTQAVARLRQGRGKLEEVVSRQVIDDALYADPMFFEEDLGVTAQFAAFDTDAPQIFRVLTTGRALKLTEDLVDQDRRRPSSDSKLAILEAITAAGELMRAARADGTESLQGTGDGDQLLVTQLDWTIFPQGTGVPRQIVDELVAEARRVDPGVKVDLSRMQILQSVARTWGEEEARYARGTLGNRRSVTDPQTNVATGDQYVAVFLGVNPGSDDLAAAKAAVAESPIVGHNALYVARKDVTPGNVSVQDVLSATKEVARAMGARRLTHTSEPEVLAERTSLLLAATPEEFGAIQFSGWRIRGLPGEK
jgi:hypothetical protein